MRNSNIILGAAAFVLGVAGAINSIGANRFVSDSRVLTANGFVCTLFTCLCGSVWGICTTGTISHRTVYTINSTNCVNIHPRI
jgi:hypothetical protein